MAHVQIDEIWIYPVKSCRGLSLRTAMIGERGLLGDREWLVVDEQRRFLTQRTHPALACVAASLDGDMLRLSAPQQPVLTLPRDARALGGAMTRVRIFSDEVDAMDAGADAARWVSAVLGAPARLVRAIESTRREPDARWRGAVSAPVNFPDAFPLLVCNTASLSELNRRLPQPVPMNRFRPNIVISGPQAFAEDQISALRTASVDLHLVKPCLRCSTTIVDQESGVPGIDPLPALKQFRFDRELLGVKFGQNAVIARGVGEVLRVGPAEALAR